MTGNFPDVEDALCEILDDIAPTLTQTGDFLDPEDEAAGPPPPCIVVNRVGGGADSLGLFDRAVVEVGCFGESRAASKALNAAVRQRLSGAYCVQTAAGFIDRVDEDTAPAPVPYGLEYLNIRRQSSTWVVDTRSS